MLEDQGRASGQQTHQLQLQGTMHGGFASVHGMLHDKGMQPVDALHHAASSTPAWLYSVSIRYR